MLRELHPAVIISYFAVVTVITMTVKNPIMLFCNLVFSCTLFILIKDKCSLKTIAMFAATFLVIALINPFFNLEGTTVLFTYLDGRPYTLEALRLGAKSAAMFVALLFWFSILNILLSANKMTYLFGRYFPKSTMVLGLVMRFIPMFAYYTRQATWAFAGVGQSLVDASLSRRIKISCAILRCVCITSISKSIVTADSMCARGYRCGKLTHYVRYSINPVDFAICIFVFALGVLSIANVVPSILSYMSYMTIVVMPVVVMVLSRILWDASLLRM